MICLVLVCVVKIVICLEECLFVCGLIMFFLGVGGFGVWDVLRVGDYVK